MATYDVIPDPKTNVQLILKIAIVQFSTFQAWDIVMLLASI
jgi:hypothetical protein